MAIALPALWETGGHARAQDPLGDRVAMWIGIGPITWIIWRVVASRVIIRPDGVTVVNPITRTVAPWAAIAAVGSDPVSIVLSDTRRVVAFAFSGSTLADLTGDRSAATAARQLAESFRAHSSEYDPLAAYSRRATAGIGGFLAATLCWMVVSYIAYRLHR
jgi:hypothetical protein